MICYGLTRTRNSQQEWYETASRHAGKRARLLRKLGFKVTVSAMGDQVTNVGRVRMTILTVHQLGYDDEVPAPERLERV